MEMPSDQDVLLMTIASRFPIYLLPPPRPARFRQTEMRAVLVSVPEAAVNEDHGVVFRQDDVGSAGKRFVFRAVHREAVAHAVQHGAQGEFGFRIPPAYPRHDLAAFFRCEDVHGLGCLQVVTWHVSEACARF